MSTIPESRFRSGRLAGLLTSDFCPGVNRYVDWLKEPLGWFVLAVVVSVIVGRHVNPAGWSMASILLAVMAAGVIWPWAAVRLVTCRMQPRVPAVHEGERCRMRLMVRNRSPLPAWGLAVEGYLDSDGEALLPTVGLASVPPLCTAEYLVAVEPALRGQYPLRPPHLVCAFPFGIWTARRPLAAVEPLMVWPKVYPITPGCPFVGSGRAELGAGERAGRGGDFVGVRSFRRGDSPRQIHWAHSARTQQLIVTERSAPQCVELDLALRADAKSRPRFWTVAEWRESLAWRVRVAASLVLSLRQESAAVELWINGRRLPVARGERGTFQLLDALAMIPADGLVAEATGAYRRTRLEIGFDAADPSSVVIDSWDPSGGKRAGGASRRWSIDCSVSPEPSLRQFWRELGDDSRAA